MDRCRNECDGDRHGFCFVCCVLYNDESDDVYVYRSLVSMGIMCLSSRITLTTHDRDTERFEAGRCRFAKML